MVDLLQWAAGLGVIAKVLASVAAIVICLFILAVLWSPRPRSPISSSGPTIQQQSGGPNSPNIAVVGSDNIVNPLPAERTIDDAAAAGIIARIAPFRGQRVRVSAANNEEAQRLGTRIRDLIIAAGWDCPSFVGQAFLPTQLGLPGVRVEASPGTDAAATALADALSGSTSTGLTLNSGYTSDAPGTIMIIVFPNPRP